MRLLGTVLVLGTAAVLPLALAPTPAAAAATAVASWEMNESAGYGGTMTDSSGRAVTGVIGSKVQRGVKVGGRTGYRFASEGSAQPGQDRLITVADRAELDPGTRTYSLTVTFRTGATYSNMVQKGQSNTAGGFYKVDMTKGIAYCTFKGASGQRAIGSGRALNDSAWHTVTCTRDATGVSMSVDGAAARRIAGPTGAISNADALTIGGKKSCNQTTVGCDYFIGVLDRVLLSAG